ncbi:CaiB/BaiF CoA transferase family protein [Advenella mimigardefordensis]|uniref:Putative acyl-CoA transferase family 3 n=1 Tax=Advenella mimigardefordensis (strain DSM 17166 / LMG 22922 / DPN7) TaxID=1247726 RepID=W0PG80_ADVMD|nr:CoA transferase [Advenella mimigardefordensis]AHG64098.1 putative acyl-CoA transferase family 3 [Advenella mimigardefordensis DPN7]
MSESNFISSPLQGVKVIELSHLIAGPYCGQLLAEEGASVVKIEPPDGELTRHREPMRRVGDQVISGYFASLNRGKQSVSLDLKNESGIQTLHRLLETADVVLTNMRGGALKRLGIHPDELRKRYPRLIIACISGFGLHNAGKFTDRAGLAMVAEAMSGTTSLTRDHDGNPVWCGFALGDIVAGMAAHSAILLALRNQEKYGVGRVLDMSMVECSLPMVSVALAREQSASAELRAFAGSNNFHGVPYGAFPASDGFVNIGVNRDDFWKRLCKAMGRPELGTDPRYETYIERAKNQRDVHQITEAFTRQFTRDDIVAKLNAVDVPVASILTMAELTNDEYLQTRGALRQVNDGIGGSMMLPVDPSGFTPAEGSHLVPLLNEHRDTVLARELNLSANDISCLEQAGAFGTPMAMANIA